MHYHIILERFQLTRSRGAWPVAVRKSIHYLKNFNSHAHVERDRRNALHLTSWILFQLTRSRGAWPSFVSIVFHVLKFQLTRSRGAWRYWKMLPVLTLHFNSHAHVERDLLNFYHLLCVIISTHTLTWSVTGMGFWRSLLKIHFNSHAHVERDEIVRNWINAQSISTHTLTWSVTGIISSSYLLIYAFQLTRSRGAWLQNCNYLLWQYHFNSHAHVERDIIGI